MLFGATGDLSRRKLLPGLTYLALSALTPDIQVVGTSLEDMDDEAFRAFAQEAVTEFGTRRLSDEQWDDLRRQAALRAAERRAGGAGRGGRTRPSSALGERRAAGCTT